MGLHAVGGRSDGAEGNPKGFLEPSEMRIPAVVGIRRVRIPSAERGKGSQAMKVNLGLVGPNPGPNWDLGKGKGVNIPPTAQVRCGNASPSPDPSG